MLTGKEIYINSTQIRDKVLKIESKTGTVFP